VYYASKSRVVYVRINYSRAASTSVRSAKTIKGRIHIFGDDEESITTRVVRKRILRKYVRLRVRVCIKLGYIRRNEKVISSIYRVVYVVYSARLNALPVYFREIISPDKTPDFRALDIMYVSEAHARPSTFKYLSPRNLFEIIPFADARLLFSRIYLNGFRGAPVYKSRFTPSSKSRTQNSSKFAAR